MPRRPAPPDGVDPDDHTISPTIEQLRVFLAVVDEGGFGAAARKLGRATSVVSYALANLESELGMTLFDREGSRKPRLTAKGKALLSEVRRIDDDMDRLRARVAGLTRGIEPSVSLALDVMVPMSAAAELLRDFAAAWPTVPMQLHVEALGGGVARLLSGRADLAVAGPMANGTEGTDNRHLGAITLVPVCAPAHPLAARTLRPGDVREHLQLVLTDRSALTEGREFSVLSPRTWRIADLSAKHALLTQGIGWGNMPLHMVQDDLDAGRLVRMNLAEAPAASYDLWLLTRRGSAPGLATAWLIDALERVFRDAGEC
ncbi:LysR family transcriptional regulator [Paracoccus aeridis]|uniref:LysR family transcriptional regulator n=1 Tax=Paracoccus aeridis TaxID=1966466 RepID=UPI00191C5921|nr:LysR family transcriptional regulator [Paracoccus aeridis]